MNTEELARKVLRELLPALREMFTEFELHLIMDCCHPDRLKTWDAKHLADNVADGIRRYNLAEAWDVDADMLLEKVKSLSPVPATVLLQVMERLWEMQNQGLKPCVFDAFEMPD